MLSSTTARLQLRAEGQHFAGARGKLVASIEPRAGRALLHRHGDACLAHEGRAVRAGVKYVLRSDVVVTV